MRISRLEDVASGSVSVALSVSEEKAMVSFMSSLSGSGIPPHPLTPERVEELKETRTLTTEDRDLARWILDVWRIIYLEERCPSG